MGVIGVGLTINFLMNIDPIIYWTKGTVLFGSFISQLVLLLNMNRNNRRPRKGGDQFTITVILSLVMCFVLLGMVQFFKKRKVLVKSSIFQAVFFLLICVINFVAYLISR